MAVLCGSLGIIIVVTAISLGVGIFGFFLRLWERLFD